MHVLLVEDDALVASGIIAGLRLHGFTVDNAETVQSADSALQTAHFDLMILDLGLPDDDGMVLLRRVRSAGAALPILVLTARDTLQDKVAGLRAGADDYLQKPFNLEELIARLHALRRRSAGRAVDSIIHGDLSFDLASHQVMPHGLQVDLSRREMALLQALLHDPNRVLSAEQVKDCLYGFGDNVESNAVNVHIHPLRRKLGLRLVETVRGIGYRLGEAGP